ncbi:PAS domain S-box protein [Sphaerothrix gracilis]|uniref:PAS domain S-box protein n=1 Tax=Sphaerothrix gracilis TaxID=3151835 RepID=UPI0031FDE70E
MQVPQSEAVRLAAEQLVDHQPLLLTAAATIAEALAAMRQSHKNYVLIVEAEKLVGILTERDVVRLAAQKQIIAERCITEVMTRSLVTYPVQAQPDIFQALAILQQHCIRHLPVVDVDNQLQGLITYETLRLALQPTDLLRLKTVGEVMQKTVLQASASDSLLEVTQRMHEQKASCVVVMQPASADSALSPTGIITERDIVQLQAAAADFARTQAAQIMSQPLIPIQPQDTLWQAHQCMTQHGVRRLVVRTEIGALAGLLTQRELLRSLDPLEMYQSLQALRTLVQQQTEDLQQTNTRLQRLVADYETVKHSLEATQAQLRTEIATCQIAERSLQATNQALEQRVAERTAQLEVANRLLQEQVQTLVHSDGLSGQENRLAAARWTRFWGRNVRIPRLDTFLRQYPVALGVTITLAMVLLVEGCRRIGVMLPVPFLLVLVSVMLSAGMGGLRAGLGSAAVWTVFVLYAAAVSFGPITLIGGPAQISLGILVILFAVLRQGIASDRYRAVTRLLISTNQNLDRQVQQRTADLETTNRQLAQQIQERQQAEADLRDSESRFRGTFEQAAVGIAHVALNGTFLRLNQRFCDIVGYQKAELTGKTFQEITYTEDLEEDLACVQQVLNGEMASYSIEKRYIHKDGSLIWINLTVSLLSNLQGQPKYFISVIQDISDRKRIEAERTRINAELQESETLYRGTFEQAAVGIVNTSAQGHLLKVNRKFCEITGYSSAELIGQHFRNLTYPEDQARDLQLFQQMLAGQRSQVSVEKRYVRKDGALVWVNITVASIRGANGEPQYQVVIVEDISDRKAAEQHQKNLTTILESTTDFVGMADSQGQIRYINTAGCHMIGVTFADLAQKHVSQIHPAWAIQKITHEGIPAAVETGHWQGETAVLTHQNQEIPVSQLIMAHLDEQGQVQFFSTIMRDLSQTYQAERDRQDAETKALLLKEIHHRIKNNLQIVSGILYLQSRTLEQPAALKALQDCRDRIEAMALIHEKFYGSSNLETIDFKAYARSLTQNLISSYAINQNIRFKAEIDPILLNIDTAVACGLIINELVTNALQHAFVGKQYGEILVVFYTEKSGLYRLIVRDNGAGFSDQIDFKTATSMGLRLVRMLVFDQLRGTVEISCDRGTKFSVEFSISDVI